MRILANRSVLSFLVFTLISFLITVVLFGVFTIKSVHALSFDEATTEEEFIDLLKEEVLRLQVILLDLMEKVAELNNEIQSSPLGGGFTWGDSSVLDQVDYDLKELALMVHEEVNNIRRENGLISLSWNDDLSEVALRHSDDQARDNEWLIDINKPCLYPILRHEGFEFGLNVGDRLRNSNIHYTQAAENLVLFSAMKNSIFRVDHSGDIQSCDDFNQLDLSFLSSESQKKEFLEAEIEKRKEALDIVSEVNWVNREWKSAEDIAKEAAEKWFDSPGHRNNMLNTNVRESGVGVALVEGYLIITHVFTRQ